MLAVVQVHIGRQLVCTKCSASHVREELMFDACYILDGCMLILLLCVLLLV